MVRFVKCLFKKNCFKDFNMFWEMYREAKLSEGVLTYTLEKYQICLAKFELWLMDTKQTPSTKTVQRFLLYLHEEGLSDFRIRNYWVSLMSFYTWAETEGHITHNPMKGVRAPKLPKKTIEIYRTAEIRRLINHINRIDYQTIFTFYWRTGLRGTELLTTVPDDFNYNERTVHIHGKGSKERVIPFDNECLNLLIRNPQHPFDKSLNQVRRKLISYCNESEVRYRGIHCFRHTFACKYLMAGGNPLDLKYILGHSSLAMVDYYTQWVASERAIRAYHKMTSDR